MTKTRDEDAEMREAVISGVINQQDLEVCVKVALSSLAASYVSSLELYEMEKGEDPEESEDPDFKAVSSVSSFSLKSLRKQLADFKRDMFEAMIENYFPLRDAGKLHQQNLARYIKSEVDDLKRQVAFLKVKIPEAELKAGLGIHFPLHQGLSSLTTEMITEYFEMNYLLKRE